MMKYSKRNGVHVLVRSCKSRTPLLISAADVQVEGVDAHHEIEDQQWHSTISLLSHSDSRSRE